MESSKLINELMQTTERLAIARQGLKVAHDFLARQSSRDAQKINDALLVINATVEEMEF